ncbi:hypothetical protein EIN_407860 [Entamoeba invadens IP1]|uniref:Uncharacterized protein n=1 Tax=Entamoeba invadens IP1 TaxID=370355 RepID=A0A0A1TWJ4_ENTIV|nr:hypothetical protein EIN_407860 [Entamoeba invadens IP1]ELP85567.1 hypothetical protein EIN_407860 [Entamoeba invadens IP1]|eukprot:XP_004184913.1 hypothetical protein EIN_407860 [Entamoeba invadens IP1]
MSPRSTVGVVVLGNKSTGKSHFISQLQKNINNNSKGNHNMRNELFKEAIEIKEVEDEYTDVTKTFSIAKIMIILFSVDSQESLKDSPRWIGFGDHYMSTPYLKFLIGNKSDIKNRAVKQDDAKDVAAKCNAFYLEVSSLTSGGIQEVVDIISLEYFTFLKTSTTVLNSRNACVIV